MYGSSAPWGGIAQAPSGQRRKWGTSGHRTCSGQSFAAFCKRLSFLLLEAGLTQLSAPPLGKNAFSGLQQVPRTDDFCSVLSVILDKTQAFVLFKKPLKTEKKKRRRRNMWAEISGGPGMDTAGWRPVLLMNHANGHVGQPTRKPT